MSDEINTQYTKEIVCPYCFYKESESWDNLEDSSDEKQCNNCEKIFAYERNYKITYCTVKNDEANIKKMKAGR